MKKIIIHLFPFKFTNHDFISREYDEFKKKFKTNVIIHDLSKFFHPNVSHIKAKNFKHSIKFKSLNQWINVMKKLKKKKKIIIVNELSHDSFKSLLIHYYLKKSKIPMLIDDNVGVYDSKLFSKNLNLQKIVIKIKKILKNISLLTYFLKKKILNCLFLLIKFENINILVSSKNKTLLPFRFKTKKIIQTHSRDFSNYLISRKKNIIKKNNHIVFLDATVPFTKGDEEFLTNHNENIDVDKWYKEHNLFFDKLENYFSTKVVIVPHPKLKGVKNPYYKKRVVDHRLDAALQLTRSSLFVISGIFVSTAISFAIADLKPIFFIYSDQMKFHFEKNIIIERESAKLIGSKVININNFKKEEITNNMAINKKLYSSYKYKYLTTKNLSNNPNHIILGNLIRYL